MKYKEIKQELSRRGYYIKFKHKRLPKDFVYTKGSIKEKDTILTYSKYKNELDKDKISARGGVTYCNILDRENKLVCVSIAVCSLSDVFSKKTGRVKSLGRAYSVFKIKDILNDKI